MVKVFDSTLGATVLANMSRILSLIFLLSIAPQVYALEARIKDIVYFESIRENLLIGYGLVVGLNGTGDNLNNSVFTKKGLMEFLDKLGVSTRGSNLKTKNIAAVTVTAHLPPFARSGSKIDVSVSTIGDAKSIEGGTLIATPMLGADGEVYAVAQGAISIGIPSGANKKLNPAAGYISAGGIIERENEFDLNSLNLINLALKNPDISTSRSVEVAINSVFRNKIAVALDPGTVRVSVPIIYRGKVMSLLSEIEQIKVVPNTTAKVVINEATGTIVIGENVRVNKVAIAQENLMIEVGTEDDTTISDDKVAVLNQSVNLQELVKGLNMLGVAPKDLISILKTIQRSGAMQAEIVTQ